MLSLIICSVNPGFLQQVKENIASTIGIEYELLAWDNRAQQKGLCEIYNTMAARARFPYICFLHEDILFGTKNWGNIVINLFIEDRETGVIGIAGSKYKSKMFSGWYSGIPGLDYYRITHRTDGKDHAMVSPGSEMQGKQQVVCVDGVFIACRKEIWKKIQFNQELLKGFHFYDIEFSLRASMSVKVIVTLDIQLTHITIGGDYGDKWVDAAILFHTSQEHFLPYYIGELITVNDEVFIAKQWLDRLKKEKISFRNRIQWIVKQRLYFFPVLWYSILKFLVYRPLHLSLVHRYIVKLMYTNNATKTNSHATK